MSMKCICGGKTMCIDSRQVAPQLTVRRYKCLACTNRFSTNEKLKGAAKITGSFTQSDILVMRRVLDKITGLTQDIGAQ